MSTISSQDGHFTDELSVSGTRSNVSKASAKRGIRIVSFSSNIFTNGDAPNYFRTPCAVMHIESITLVNDASA